MIFPSPMMHKSLISLLFLFSLMTMAFPSAADEPVRQSDLQLMAQRAGHREAPAESPVFMRAGGGRPLARLNPVSLGLGGLMYVYQRFISPQLPSECLYHTSCSAFSIDLIAEYGLIKGVVSTADRLMRCNRVAALDVHPINLHPQSGRVEEGVDLYRRGDD